MKINRSYELSVSTAVIRRCFPRDNELCRATRIDGGGGGFSRDLRASLCVLRMMMIIIMAVCVMRFVNGENTNKLHARLGVGGVVLLFLCPTTFGALLYLTNPSTHSIHFEQRA